MMSCAEDIILTIMSASDALYLKYNLEKQSCDRTWSQKLDIKVQDVRE